MMSTIPPGFDRAPDGTAYRLSGPENAPVVALIHGLGLTRGVWDAMLPALGRYRVLAYDLYGHGDSAPTPRVADLRLFSDQLAGVMDHLGLGRAHVAGFSIGGMINRRFALDHPARAASLAILNSPHDRGDGQAAVEARARATSAGGSMATMEAALERWFTDAARAEGRLPDLVRHWRALADEKSYAETYWVLAHGVRELIRPDPPIQCPTLVMTSENDPGSTPAMSRAIAAEIAGADCRIVPGLRHLGLMEDPQAFARPLVDFLNRQG